MPSPRWRRSSSRASTPRPTRCFRPARTCAVAIAIANAQLAYSRYRDRFGDARWSALLDAGARPQRPLWASTATKDPAYSDVLYVEELIAPDVINTMPEATLRAFADHGDATRSFDPSRRGAGRDAPAAPSRRASTSPASPPTLEREGVRSFCDSYRELLDCIESKLRPTASAGAGRA